MPQARRLPVFHTSRQRYQAPHSPPGRDMLLARYILPPGQKFLARHKPPAPHRFPVPDNLPGHRNFPARHSLQEEHNLL